MIVTYQLLVIDRRLIASAGRDLLLSAYRQVFDELGMKIHKQDSSRLIHWPGGFGRATRAAAFITNTPESYYSLHLSSLGQPGFTTVQVGVKLVYGRWFHGREKAQAKIDRFLKKLHDVSTERGIRYAQPPTEPIKEPAADIPSELFDGHPSSLQNPISATEFATRHGLRDLDVIEAIKHGRFKGIRFVDDWYVDDPGT